jgi:hypothetical protein
MNPQFATYPTYLSNEKARILKWTARDKILVWRVLLCTHMELGQTPPPQLPAGQIAQTGNKIKWKLRNSRSAKSLENFETLKLWNSGLQKLRTNSETLMCQKSWNSETSKLWNFLHKISGNSKTLVLCRTPNSPLQQLLLLHHVHDCNAKLEFSKGIDQPGNFVLLGSCYGLGFLRKCLVNAFVASAASVAFRFDHVAKLVMKWRCELREVLHKNIVVVVVVVRNSNGGS